MCAHFHPKILSAGTFGALCLSLLCGCASVSVKEDQWTQERLALPKRVYVADYEVPVEALAVDRTGEELEAFRQEKAGNFTTELCQRITARIAPALPLAAGVRPEKGSWVVEGRFLRVNQGSRLLRSMVGLGAGGTKMEARTTVSAVGGTGRKKKGGSVASFHDSCVRIDRSRVRVWFGAGVLSARFGQRCRISMDFAAGFRSQVPRSP